MFSGKQETRKEEPACRQQLLRWAIPDTIGEVPGSLRTATPHLQESLCVLSNDEDQSTDADTPQGHPAIRDDRAPARSASPTRHSPS